MKKKPQKKAYVVGNNTSNSLSPQIFQHWFKKYKIEAEYGFFEINEKQFDHKIKHILQEKNLVGLNITIPYKEKITPHLSLIKPTKLKNLNLEIKLPTNLVTITKNQTIGHNTDIIGFNKALKNKIKNKNKQAAIFGCGGAAKAIIYSLAEAGFKEIILFNRTYEKAIKTKNDFLKNTKTSHILIKTTTTKDVQEKLMDADIIVNTVPVNVFEKTPNIKINKHCIGFDVVYKPREGTGFLKHFKSNNRIEGIQMLVYQAVPCFKMWFGFEPEVDNELFELLYQKLKNK